MLRTGTQLNIIALVIAISACLIFSAGAGLNYAETAKKKGKMHVTFGDVGSYMGKAKVKVWNLNNDKILVKAELNFEKLHNSEKEDCCFKVYEFKWKGNHVGDSIAIRITGEDCGRWEDDSGFYTLKKGTTKIGIDLDEIGEC